MENTTSSAIGIDLGTTNSCVAVWKNGQIQIAPSEMGTRTTPSVVSFTDSERIIGVAARKRMKSNFANTVYDTKRLIGHAFKDNEIQNDIKMWPFKVTESVEGKPVINVTYKKEKQTLSPEQISAMILEQMKKQAEEFLDTKVTNAVITVPAYFNDSQRQATKDAATIAGLNVLRILNEPTAAALAYSMEESLNKKTILVYDIGGGTFDATILKVDDQYSVLSSKGDIHLGGVDFTHAMEDLIKARIRDFLGNDYEFSKNQETKIAKLAEEKKMELSNDQVVEFYEDDIISGVGVFSISRHQFEEAIAPYLNKAQDILLDALNDAHLAKDDIDAIILIGGTSVIPSIRTRLTDFFAGKPVLQTIDPNTAVSRGAMNYAALYLGVVDLRGVVIPQKEVVPEGLGEQYREYVVSNPHDMEIPLPITESFEHQ